MSEAQDQAPAAAKGKPRGAASVTPPPRRSALLTWMGRLLIVALCLAGVLAWGFYQAPGPDGQPQRKLPWDDPQAFQTYAQDTFVWARAEGEKAAVKAKQKLDEIQWGKEADDLWKKADAFLGGSSGASTADAAGPQPGTGTAVAASGGARPASGASPATSSSPASKPSTPAPASTAAGKPPGAAEGDPAIGPGSTPKPGYYEAYKAGYKSYRDGLVHFRNAKATKSRSKELRAALDDFRDASTSWQTARDLRDSDRNLDELMRDLNQYIKETRTLAERS